MWARVGAAWAAQPAALPTSAGCCRGPSSWARNCCGPTWPASRCTRLPACLPAWAAGSHLRPSKHLLHRSLLPLALLPGQLAQLLPHRAPLITVPAAHCGRSTQAARRAWRWCVRAHREAGWCDFACCMGGQAVCSVRVTCSARAPLCTARWRCAAPTAGIQHQPALQRGGSIHRWPAATDHLNSARQQGPRCPHPA